MPRLTMLVWLRRFWRSSAISVVLSQLEPWYCEGVSIALVAMGEVCSTHIVLTGGFDLAVAVDPQVKNDRGVPGLIGGCIPTPHQGTHLEKRLIASVGEHPFVEGVCVFNKLLGVDLRPPVLTTVAILVPGFNLVRELKGVEVRSDAVESQLGRGNSLLKSLGRVILVCEAIDVLGAFRSGLECLEPGRPNDGTRGLVRLRTRETGIDTPFEEVLDGVWKFGIECHVVRGRAAGADDYVRA